MKAIYSEVPLVSSYLTPVSSQMPLCKSLVIDYICKRIKQCIVFFCLCNNFLVKSAFCQRFQQGHRSIAQVFCCAALICAILRHILLLLRWYCLFYLRLLLTNRKFSAILILVIRSQKLVGPVIGGVPAGTPLFIFEVIVCRNHF